MTNQDPTQTPATDEDEDDDQPAIGGWSVFWALLLGFGFVVHMTYFGIGEGPKTGLHSRIHFFFVLLGGAAIAGMALAGLTRLKKPTPKPPTADDAP